MMAVVKYHLSDSSFFLWYYSSMLSIKMLISRDSLGINLFRSERKVVRVMTRLAVRPRPELMAVRGGWMARSTKDSRIGIGVIACTKDEAMREFEPVIDAWPRLLEADKRSLAVAWFPEAR